ncbi:uncharacterized protein EV422DRAFT_507171 [Fimicolochytrium jonesii]|uniref:uncharacterized protein n=1 Tax=Fimicolochytrium jonesii TaxID=1396493 RepID=UPI0022FEDD66|nr:uncharacterized protein EV422DRAFT_507171 [Fimicolochytrium jonesii]KAI8820023.1 hypothetical protein EV422DRAFT_507171 [Fimicolochytrium jonesii]
MSLNFSDPAVYGQAVAAPEVQEGVEYCTGIATQFDEDIGSNGGSAIIMGMGWPMIGLGLVVSGWRLKTRPDLRAYLLFACTCLSVADCAVLAWARSNPYSYTYRDHLYLFSVLLIPWSIVRNSTLLMASALRFRAILTNKPHQKALVAGLIIIATATGAAELGIAYRDVLQNEFLGGISSYFWGISVIKPLVYSLVGLGTFTKGVIGFVTDGDCLRPSRKPQQRCFSGIPRGPADEKYGAYQQRPAPFHHDHVYPDDNYYSSLPGGSWYTNPIQQTVSVYWVVGENLFEVLALFKTSADQASNAQSESTGSRTGPRIAKSSSPAKPQIGNSALADKGDNPQQIAGASARNLGGNIPGRSWAPTPTIALEDCYRTVKLLALDKLEKEDVRVEWPVQAHKNIDKIAGCLGTWSGDNVEKLEGIRTEKLQRDEGANLLSL